MASSPIKWEELASEASRVHRLLSEHLSNADSPHFISRISEPDDLVLNNYDTPTDGMQHSFSRSDCGKQNVYGRRDSLIALRTPLRDTSNVTLKPTDIQEKTGSAPATPKKSTGFKDSPNIQCPSSAELKEFLSGIMEVSPVFESDEMDSFETNVNIHNNKQHRAKHNFCSESEQLSTQKIMNEIALSHIDSESKSIHSKKGTRDLHSVKEIEIVSNAQEESVEQSSNSNFREEKPSTKLSRQDTFELLTSSFCLNNTIDHVQLPEAESHIGPDSVQLPLDFKDPDSRNARCAENTSFTLIDMDNISGGSQEKRRELSNLRSVEIDLSKLHTKEDVQCHGEDLVFLEDGDIAQLHESKSGHWLPSSGSASVPLTPLKDMQDLCETMSEDKQNGPEFNKDSLLGNVKIEDLGTGVDGIDFSSNKDNQPKPQVDPDNMTKKGKRSFLNMPLKVQAKKCSEDSQGASSPPVTKLSSVAVTKLPLMKFRKMPSKLGLKRPSLDRAKPNLQPVGSIESHQNSVSSKGEDVNVLSRTITKSQPTVSRLACKESLGASKPVLREIKPPIKQIPKPVETSKMRMKIPQLPDQRRLITKVSGQQIVKMVQPTVKLPIGPLSKPNPSNVMIKVTRKSSMNGTQLQQPAPAMNKPEIPALDASKTVTKEPKKGPLKALLPIAQCVPGANKTPKIASGKTEFPMHGSLTITKGDQPVGSRTVTKEGPEIDSKTVSKATGESQSFKHAQATPMKNDSFLVPRRLSDAFFSPSRLSDCGKERIRTSGIPTPTRLQRSSSTSSKSSASSNASFRKPALSDFESPSIANRDTLEYEMQKLFQRKEKPRCALVKNTPDVEPRRQSMWSPVKKNRVLAQDMPYYCTKRVRGPMDSAS